MTLFKSIFRLLWIGICALAMLSQTRFVLGLPLAPDLLDGYVLGSTVFAYGFTHSDRRLKTVSWLAGLFGGACYALSAWPLLSGSPPAQRTPEYWPMTALLPLLLWLLYYGLQRPGTAGLRGVPAAKPVVVGLTWAIVTVLLPLPAERWSEASIMFSGRAIFIFALALAYDLSDLVYDRRHGLSTLAGRVGASGTFRFMDAALALAFLCYCANFFLHVFPLYATAALIASLVFSAWWLRFLLRKSISTARQKLLIDALMPLQLLLIWLASFLEI